MRHLRILSLMLLAALALGSFAAATASATEPGLLPLAKATVEVKAQKSTGKAILKGVGGDEITCTSLDETIAKAGEATHVTLFNEVTLTFLGCKQKTGTAELNCRSETLKAEKDAIETILVLADFHIVNLLNGTTLEPGLAVILLDQSSKEVGTVKIVCGTGIFEVKGVVKGKSKVASLSADIESGTFIFASPEPKCDTSDELCENLAKEPFLAKLLKVFEPAILTVETPFKVAPMVLVDD
jgi:hypothetical protein